MSEVKRYDISEFGGGMVEVEDGAWCHSDDYDSICNEWRVATGAVIMQRKEMAALRAQVEVMRAALEDAAKGILWLQASVPMSIRISKRASKDYNAAKHAALQAKP